MTLREAYREQFEHGGYVAGQRAIGALRAARAFLRLHRDPAVRVRWFDDPEPAEYQDEKGAWYTAPAVACVIDQRQPCGHWENNAVSLWGIIESDNLLERETYRRVVEAQLAEELYA